MGASSFSPSPITTTPSIATVFRTSRMASTAAWSAAFLSPRPSHRPAASAAASVTRARSMARLRSGAWCASTAGTVPPDRLGEKRRNGAISGARALARDRQVRRHGLGDLHPLGALLDDDSLLDARERRRRIGEHLVHVDGRVTRAAAE